jgi:2',3'-cyclic-nucleotide 2'-phosphodiesterase (5'-nucleotidase family)
MRGTNRGDARVTILQTTDLHHHANGVDHVGLDVDPVSGMSATGAYARIAAYVDFVRDTTDHPVVLVDSGDWTMGTLYDFTLSQPAVGTVFPRAHALRLHYAGQPRV